MRQRFENPPNYFMFMMEFMMDVYVYDGMNSAILSDSLLRWIQEVAQAHVSISSNVLNFNIIQMYFFFILIQ